MKLICKHCGKEFEHPYFVKYCSKECRYTQYRQDLQSRLMAQYGVTNFMQIPEIAAKISRRKYERAHISPDKLPRTVDTKISCSALYAILDLLAIQYVKNYNIGDFTYSAYLPECSTVINVCDTINYNIFRVPNKNQLAMLQVAESNGLRCVHIFDWDNLEKIYMMFLPKRKIYARNCTVEVIDRKLSEPFLTMFHLQGGSQKDRVRYGLYYEDRLVEVMTFCKSRFTKKFDWELLRMCTDCDYQVIGGSSKLFARFIRDNSPKSVISYCDLSKFSGAVYSKLGMSLYQQIPPNKVWTLGSRRITDRMLCTVGYDELFNAHFGKGTSNEQLMLDHGWLPVQDCGQRTYLWTPNKEDAI